MALAVWALALELLEVDFGQSLAIWPGCPQNMQSLSLMHCWRSSSVNLPSFPRWVGVSEEAGVKINHKRALLCPVSETEEKRLWARKFQLYKQSKQGETKEIISHKSCDDP